MGFRYPVSKNGKPTLRELKLTHVSMRHLNEVMERISAFLDGTIDGILVYLDAKQAAFEGDP
jgi:hypothetical protein